MISRRQLLKVSGISALSTMMGISCRSVVHGQLVGESRAIFDEGLDWVTETGAHNLCSRMKAAGFNALAVCVWHGRGASWPSNIAPWDNDKLESLASRTPNFDPLATLLRIAEQYKLEVHAWFTVMLRQRAFLREYYDEGTPEQGFEVHRPEFRDFISRVISECIARYPVHGINLDYIRAMAISKSTYCVQDYKKATGRNLTMDRLSYAIGTESRVAIARWQEEAVGDIVQRVSKAARSANPELVISVCANPGHPDLYIQGQDSVKWANNGLIDVIFAMHYEPEPDWTAIQVQQRLLKRPESLVVLCGNYDRIDLRGPVVTRAAKHVSELLKRARGLNPHNGVALYLSGLVDDDQVAVLSSDAFRVPAKTHWLKTGRVGSAIAPPSSGVKP